MTKQVKIIIIFIILVMGIVGFTMYRNHTTSGNLAGGDRDEYGCTESTGYSWCEAKNKCLKQREEKCEPEKTSVKGATLPESEARVIAEKTCIKGGESLSPGYYNENSKTWWYDANLNATREGCNPACVVSEETKTADVNWRCTGLIAPKSSK